VPISPIDIATQGTLNSPLSVAAVRGHLTIEAETPVIEGPGGGGVSGMPGEWVHPFVRQDMLRSIAEREDEEILAIIMAFMRQKK
jgi:hypothetical protein